MRRALDLLYGATGALAALSLAAIFALVLADILLRQFGGQVRSADDLSGFALAAAGALALAPTYRRGEHVRVGMIADRLTGRPRRGLEMAVALAAILCAGWATLWMARFAADSRRYGELTTGLLALPVWPAQAVMTFGLGMLVVAFLDDLAALLRGRPAGFAAARAAADAAADAPTMER